MSKIRVYTPTGREVWITRPGQTVPGGYLSGTAPFAPFPGDMVAVWVRDEGDPDDSAPSRRFLALIPTKP